MPIWTKWWFVVLTWLVLAELDVGVASCSAFHALSPPPGENGASTHSSSESWKQIRINTGQKWFCTLPQLAKAIEIYCNILAVQPEMPRENKLLNAGLNVKTSKRILQSCHKMHLPLHFSLSLLSSSFLSYSFSLSSLFSFSCFSLNAPVCKKQTQYVNPVWREMRNWHQISPCIAKGNMKLLL